MLGRLGLIWIGRFGLVWQVSLGRFGKFGLVGLVW